MEREELTISSEKSDVLIEPLLDPSNDRNNLIPIVHHDFWNHYQKAKASFWVPEEIDFSADLTDWDTKLSSSEKQFLEANFALFLIFDQIVIKNLQTNFVDRINIPEVRMFYRFQEMIEDIHIHTYSLFPITFIKDEKRLKEINNTVLTFPILKKLVDWSNKWIKKDDNSVEDFARRIVAFIIVEGVIFSGSFASIFYMKKKGVMPGVAQANELIARDEEMHKEFGLLVLKHLVYKIPKDQYIGMMKEAVNLVIEFCTESIPVDMIGMNNKLMAEYIKFVSDRISKEIIGEYIYKAENPFTWMSMINLQGKTNFFDRKVTQYSRASVLNKQEDNKIRYDAEF
jgi:ribonucleoside-diphosphate reductase beta chain